MGGGGTRESIITGGQAGSPATLPELQPFVRRVGELATKAIDFPELGLQRFATDRTAQIPGMAPLQTQVAGMAQQRLNQGIPVPFPEQVAFGPLENLRTRAAQAVPLSPYTTTALGTAGQAANVAGTPRAEETQGIQGLQQFLPGGTGISPVLQQAITGLENQIVPQVQNQAARIGLAQSGFLPQEIGRAYARELVPLFQQGMQQQQQAANQLFQAGGSLAGRELQGLQGRQAAEQVVGGMEQALGTDAFMRDIQATLQGAAPLLEMGQREQQRPETAMRQALSIGDLQRSIESEMAQQDLQSYLRAREMAMNLVNPFGSFTTFGGVPQTTQTTKSSGGNYSFGK